MRSVENKTRDAGRRLEIGGVPIVAFLIYLVWCRYPSFMTLGICSGILVFFGILSYFGWPLSVLLQRLLHMIRGKKKSGRPWWYRRFYE
ncbi:IcmT/TraK family protein [Serratia ficaria]|uniref:IcmT/TraK family protein n=1 Tax=Serratia ficaria TaxID=61651 RepID=UPI00077C2B45|nr:IcmT/TraK family protein [Serratia ficaria]